MNYWHKFWIRMKFALARLVGLELTHSQERYFSALSSSLLGGSVWLDVGCGNQIVPSWAIPLSGQQSLAARAGAFIGIDLDDSMRHHPLLKYRCFASASALPFAAGSVDLITANMVVEHLHEPEVFFRESARVLAPGGRLLIHTPNLRNYLVFLAWIFPETLKKPVIRLIDERREEEVFRTYYRANTTTRIRELAASSGLSVESLAVNGSVGSFSLLGPIAVLEVLVLKVLSTRLFRPLNSTLLVKFRKM